MLNTNIITSCWATFGMLSVLFTCQLRIVIFIIYNFRCVSDFWSISVRYEMEKIMKNSMKRIRQLLKGFFLALKDLKFKFTLSSNLKKIIFPFSFKGGGNSFICVRRKGVEGDHFGACCCKPIAWSPKTYSSLLAGFWNIKLFFQLSLTACSHMSPKVLDTYFGVA